MNKKENRGITLVALVITIIVLIILAGVSINAVMNDGLIGNAKNARNEYDAAKRAEELALIDLEVQTDFLDSGISYKFKNGYLTGINLLYDSTYSIYETETVKSVKDKLPKGYGIFVYDDSGENLVPATETDNVATGMVVKKDDTVIGEIVVFGDVNTNGLADGAIIATDMSQIAICFNNAKVINYDYVYIASDVNHDGMIDWQDATIVGVIDEFDESLINQDVYADSKSNLKTEKLSQSRQNYVNGLSDTLKSKFEWNGSSYIVKGLESGATVGSLELPSDCIVTRTNESNETVKLGAEDPIQSGDQISLLKTYNGVEITLLLGQVE